jgi:hypothetical protein
MAATPYALSYDHIATALAHTDQEEERIYQHNSKTNSC